MAANDRRIARGGPAADIYGRAERLRATLERKSLGVRVATSEVLRTALLGMALGGVAWRLGDEHNGCEAGGSAATIGLAVLDLAMDHVVRQAAPEEKQLGIQTPPRPRP